MVIFAISGSLRKGSSNTSILHTFKSLAPAGVEIILYDGLDRLPHFNPDLDHDDPPVEVKELRGMLKRSDAILVSTPEYAHGLPGSLKNALDWLVSTTLLENKNCALVLGSSSEGNFARGQLVEILRTMNAKVPDHLVKSISGIQARHDDPGTWQELKDLAQDLVLAARLVS